MSERGRESGMHGGDWKIVAVGSGLNARLGQHDDRHLLVLLKIKALTSRHHCSSLEYAATLDGILGLPEGHRRT